MVKHAKIGKNEIIIPDLHIYGNDSIPETYDFVPWNLIGQILKDSGWLSSRLIDIGANVGDSLAHFRRFSNERVLCIEPDPEYFAMLKTNATQLGNVDLDNRLVAPDHLLGKTAFGSNGQTGWSKPAETSADLWSGEYLPITEMMKWAIGPTVIKTDTDGFDAQILKGLIVHLQANFVPLIFFEGPLESQFSDGSYGDFVSVCNALQGMGYKLLIMTNIGMPYAYAGTNKECFMSCLRSLTIGMKRQRALCHYFDVIALHPGIVSPLHSMEQSWGDDVFNVN
ncbi:MAG: FkbM family methyltransferase [Rhizobiaceae bacterium]|nr:FkbM family methyltransferase [Rhizobiaceae bacterium]